MWMYISILGELEKGNSVMHTIIVFYFTVKIVYITKQNPIEANVI